jgi:hypothetical protein
MDSGGSVFILKAVVLITVHEPRQMQEITNATVVTYFPMVAIGIHAWQFQKLPLIRLPALPLALQVRGLG